MKGEGKWFTAIGILLIILFVGYNYHIDAKNNSSNKSPQWTAPPEAAKLKNPVKDSKESVDEGRKIYVQQCATCHGQTGKGNGPAGKYLPTKPANFTAADFQKQTDGEIFWKISEGKTPMPSYKKILKEEQIWKVIKYLRTFSSK